MQQTQPYFFCIVSSFMSWMKFYLNGAALLFKRLQMVLILHRSLGSQRTRPLEQKNKLFEDFYPYRYYGWSLLQRSFLCRQNWCVRRDPSTNWCLRRDSNPQQIGSKPIATANCATKAKQDTSRLRTTNRRTRTEISSITRSALTN